MATFFAIRDGLKDAREGKPAYFWALFTDKGEREAAMKDGWKGVGKVFILAVVLDVVYQLIEHRWTVYPGEAILVAIILAIIPYLLFRGPINRIARRGTRLLRNGWLETRAQMITNYQTAPMVSGHDPPT